MAKYGIAFGVLAIGATLVGLGAMAARYSREDRATREKIKSLGSQVLETDCGTIEYARLGEGSSVLAVHGDMGGFDQGLMLASPIFEPGFQIISVSRFGYLRSPLPVGANVNLQADMYACLLDKLGIQQTAVFAFSAGATSAIRFAARHPRRVSALILVCPAAPGQVEPPSPPRVIFDTLLRSDFVYWVMLTYLEPWMRPLIGVPKGFELTPEMEVVVKEGLASSFPLSERFNGFIVDTYDPGLRREFHESISETSPYPLSEIRTPVLLISAADDPYSLLENVRGLADRLPNARQLVVLDGGHPLLGHAEEVKAEILQFLSHDR